MTTSSQNVIWKKRSISRIILLSESATRMKRKIWHRRLCSFVGVQSFRKQNTVWSLLFTIARNIVTDKIRRYYKQEDFVSYIYNNVKDEGRNTTDETLHYHELKKIHDGIIRTLPDKRRRIYELSFEHELSCPAIAGNCLYLPVRWKGNCYWPVKRYALI